MRVHVSCIQISFIIGIIIINSSRGGQVGVELIDERVNCFEFCLVSMRLLVIMLWNTKMCVHLRA